MHRVASQVEQAVRFIRARWREAARTGIVLGSGLGSVADEIAVESEIDYGAIPHFERSTAYGHQGVLLCGHLRGAPVVAMRGRCHCYEGYTAQQVTLPIRVMKALGVEQLIVSNAAGGLNRNYRPGDVMIIDDHINLLNRNPLVGVNDDCLGPRFPDMSSPYDPSLARRALEIAVHEDFVCQRGVYAAVLGPSYETRAEIRMLRRFGADAVGMSTVPEVIVAVHAGIRVLGLSTITNICSPDVAHVANAEEVVAVAHTAGDKMLAIVTGIVAAEHG